MSNAGRTREPIRIKELKGRSGQEILNVPPVYLRNAGDPVIWPTMIAFDLVDAIDHLRESNDRLADSNERLSDANERLATAIEKQAPWRRTLVLAAVISSFSAAAAAILSALAAFR
ncbi:MAG: hypothetical protein AAGA48_28755 [Myxococcota bacterium]